MKYFDAVKIMSIVLKTDLSAKTIFIDQTIVIYCISSDNFLNHQDLEQGYRQSL